MTDIGTILPRALRITRTCPHCGATTDDVSDRRVGFTCCRGAIDAQIRWRTDDLNALRRDAKVRYDELARLQDQVRSSTGTTAQDASAKAARLQASLDARTRDYWEPLANELKQDIARYQALRDGIDPPAPDHPRPYRED